jgi:hypothetical protein
LNLQSTFKLFKNINLFFIYFCLNARAKNKIINTLKSVFSCLPGLQNPKSLDIRIPCIQKYNISTIISQKNTHAISHISGNLNPLKTILAKSNKLNLFNFKERIREVNQIKNTTLRLKEKLKDEDMKIFNPNSIDERVRDFYFDSQANTLYATLLCGQIFIFDQSLLKTGPPDDLPQFKISKKVTLKQKILKMKKIKGFRKELVMTTEESERFDEQLEALTTTTTRSRTISLASSRRSSSLMKMSGSHLPQNLINFRPRSMQK